MESQLDPRVRTTALAMLKKRGYEVFDDKISVLTNDEFCEGNEEVGSTNSIIATRNLGNERSETSREEEETIIVFFSEEMKIGITQIRAYIEEMKKLELEHAILIAKGTYTSSATKGVVGAPVRIELFTEKETRIDITEHCLQPKFEMLKRDEIEVLLKQYDIKLTQLPRMKKTDPVARFYGAKPKDVIKTTRPSETAGICTSYRVVV